MNLVSMNKKMIFFFVSFFIFQQASSMMNEYLLGDLEEVCSSSEILSEDFLKKLMCLFPAGHPAPSLQNFFCEGEMKKQISNLPLLINKLNMLDKTIEAYEASKQVQYPNLHVMILKLKEVLVASNDSIVVDVEAAEREHQDAMQRSAQGFKRQAGVLRDNVRTQNRILCCCGAGVCIAVVCAVLIPATVVTLIVLALTDTI